MGRRTWIFGMWMSILLGPLCGSAAWAKPADLPAPSQPKCVDGKDDPEHGSFSITLDFLTGRIFVEIKPKTEQPAAIDAVSPTFLSALLEHWLWQAGNALQPHKAASAEEKLADQLFRDAEQCARQGDLQKARNFYQQTHLLAPTSKVGQRAIDRLQQIEERMRDTAEESSDPPGSPVDPEALYRDIRNRTIPLGLVVVSY